MLGPNDLKPGLFFIYEGQPYEVLETRHLKMQQRRPTVETRMRNLLNGKVLERNLQQADLFEEADIQRREIKFLYNHRGQFWFAEVDDPSARFELAQVIIGEAGRFLKANTRLDAISFNGKIINIKLPIKMDFKVIQAPPAIRGNTAQGGVKQVIIETGAIVNVPLFINEGDVIKINTHTGEYTERVSKS